MQTRTFLLVIGVAFGIAAPAFGQPDLGLYVRFDSPPSPFFLRNMQKELAAVMPIFRLHWFLDAAPGSENRRVIVVTFHGSCTAPGEQRDDAQGDERPVRLGETEISDGAILPFSEIDCDQLRRFLEPAQVSDAGRESRLGRASGRVLAHELYHVLLQTREHSEKGIAKAVHSPAALLSRSLRFEQGELERISSRYK